ncbi:MAG: DUF4428 domain-containing protein [Clostridia bacterium]|nr:DUF4428 domain-containing protein [Clostridia bacterium]
MGFFGKLFEKKVCSVCGGEIGLLGNRKLEDGNLCKNCAKKLSPLFSERRHSTVDQIKEQLAYREENERQLQSFRPTLKFGIGNRKIHVDEAQGKFIYAYGSDWRDDNPDIIAFSQVTSCDTDIKEHKREIYYKDKEGNNRSYSPPRYEFSYEFRAVININSPWFDDISFELSEGKRPDNTYSPDYRELEYQIHNIGNVLMGRGGMTGGPVNGGMMNGGYNTMNGGVGTPVMGAVGNNITRPGVVQNTPAAAPQNSAWICTSCGTSNSSKFCQSCGAPAPAPAPAAPATWTCLCGVRNTGKFCSECGLEPARPEDIECSECSWTAEPGMTSVPTFCPNCGKKFDYNDLK